MTSVGLQRGEDRQLGAALQQRREEREPLHVVPVEVPEQARADERLVGRQRVAEEPQPGPEVEQERPLTVDAHRHAGGVAAVAGDIVALHRGRAADTVERDDHVRRPPVSFLMHLER